MERRKAPRRDWIIGKDDAGRAVLEWKLDPRLTKRMESDPCARTYDFLNQLEAPNLELEDDSQRLRTPRSCNPYDRDAPTFGQRRRRHSSD